MSDKPLNLKGLLAKGVWLMREGDGAIYRSSGFPPGVSRLGVTKKQRMGSPVG